MTREEAILYLKRADVTVGREIKTKTAEALEMAIEALEQEPCDDAISRKRVVEWLENATDDSIEHAIDSNLEFIPPITPQQKYEDVAKAFQLGMALGFGKRYDEMDKVIEEVKKAITPEQEPCDELDFVQPHKKMLVNLEVCKMRDATPEEREIINKHIKSISKPTGVNIWDLYKDPCEDAISRQGVLDLCERFDGSVPYSVLSNYDMLPSITSHQKTGHWEHGGELSRVFIGGVLKGINYEDWHCSNCHCVIEQSIKPKWSYCPNCGAKMVEPQESEVSDADSN